MALKRLNTGIKQREGGGLKRLDPNAMKKRREAAKALDFVPNVREDVIADVDDEALTPEEANAERMELLDDALNGNKPVTDGSTIKADLKRQRDAYANQGKTDYYGVICFADGDALTEFLKKVDYPDPEATFIDGYILAARLGIELPRPKFQLQKIRPPVKSLAGMVTAFPKK
jgi:hypothetical protein